MEYIDIAYNDICLIKDLWEKNRIYHETSSEYFGHAYRDICFEDRMEKFQSFDDAMLKITICKENKSVIGYCISTITETVGELVSIHVDASERGRGIGQNLVRIHLAWMGDNECKDIGVTVSQENDATIDFYKKMGFYPNTLFMQRLS